MDQESELSPAPGVFALHQARPSALQALIVVGMPVPAVWAGQR